MDNVLANIPAELPHEVTETLIQAESVRIERIVSRGHSSPEGFWYEQPEHEWALLVQGRARLLFEDGAEPKEMGPGDCVLIPARQRHRVQWTTSEEATVWLAVFYR